MKKLLVENIELPAILYQEDTPTGDWLDKSSDAVAWDIHGEKVIDYIFARDKINEILFIKANPNYPTIDFSGFFSLLSAEERLVMCKHVLAPYALRTMVVSEEQDYINWETLLYKTQGTESPKNPYTGRALIIEKMRRYVAHKVRKEEIAMATSQQFLKDVFMFIEWYTRAACPDFKQWLTNEVGSAYELDGFAQKSYYTADLKNELMEIYNNG
jgi:hypothetical protein